MSTTTPSYIPSYLCLSFDQVFLITTEYEFVSPPTHLHIPHRVFIYVLMRSDDEYFSPPTHLPQSQQIAYIIYSNINSDPLE